MSDTQQPVAWIDDPHKPQPHCVTDLRHCCFADYKAGKHLLYTPLYAAPPPAQPQREPLTDDLTDAVTKALRRAFSLGQRYWELADSESYSKNRQSLVTFDEFKALLEETERLVLAAVNEAMGKEQK